jgi:hypothetical protein
MNKLEAKNLVVNTFEKPFDESQFTYFIKNLLNSLDESKSQTWTGNYIPESFRNAIKSYKRVGQYTTQDIPQSGIDVLIVNVKRDITLERARTLQRNFIARHLKQRNHEAALVAFFTEGYDDWRFSLVKMDFNLNKTKIEIELSPAKRYSFLVGANERSHTAQNQFQKILTEIPSPTLNDLEQAFNIETVTREFFLEYRNLFIRTKLELDKVLKNDSKLKAEFDSKNVNSVDFSKKLLGQIVFLYFLQKKGWFGVERDSDWGTGSKKFLRELLDKKHGDYKNFFNDILEPLFYEALRYDRQDYYYSRFNCKIPFLNGGLFDPINNYDWVHTDIILSNELFSNSTKTKVGDTGDGIFDIFDRYNFTVIEDEPLEKEVAIDPELLGKAYEKFNAIRPDNFNEYNKALSSGKKGEENKFNKQYGVYYTPREIVHYMCRESLINYLASEFSDKTDLSAEASAKADAYQLIMPMAKVSTEQVVSSSPPLGETERGIIPKEDIETLINYGELLGENEAVVESKGKETETYYHKLPETIRKNAELIDEKLADILICDPAVGSGAFPVGMMHEIVSARNFLSIFIKDKNRTIYKFKRECIEKSLYGVDIDSGAVEIAKLRLWLSLVVDEDDFKEIKPLPNLDYKIVRGNSLIGFPENWKSLISEKIENLKKEFFIETRAQNKKILKDEIDNQIKSRLENSEKNFGYLIDFDFKTFFSEVFHSKTGFDIVIANPPYINIENLQVSLKEYLYNNYDTCVGRTDIYIAFIDHSLSLLNKSGTLVFIVPYAFTNQKYGTALRKKIITNNHIIQILDTSDFFVFEATVKNIVILISKQKKVEQTSIKILTSINDLDKENIISHKINQQSFLQLKDNRFETKPILDNILLKEKITNDSILFNDICFIAYGARLNHKSKSISKDFYIHTEYKNGYKPFIEGKNIERYYHKQNGWLDYHPNQHYNSMFPELFENDKIMFINVVKDVLRFSLDNQHLYNSHTIINCVLWFLLKNASHSSVTRNINQLRVNQSSNYDYRYLLAVLNSKLINWYFLSFLSEKLHFYPDDAKQLPIKKLDKTRQKDFIRIINEILKRKQKDPQANTKQLEDQIDIMVYKLYYLTYEEVKIIDPAFALTEKEYNNFKFE